MDDEYEKCTACKGSGWNPEIREKPVDIQGSIMSRQGFETLKAYIKKRLCCSKCDGIGWIDRTG